MKTNMIISTDSRTVTRMAVIARRTGSELMAGAKAVLVEALKDKMRNGIAHFVFRKRMAHVVRLVVLLTGHLLRNTSMVTLRI